MVCPKKRLISIIDEVVEVRIRPQPLYIVVLLGFLSIYSGLFWGEVFQASEEITNSINLIAHNDDREVDRL